MRPLFHIIGLGGTIMILTGSLAMLHKPSQDWAYRQLMIGLMATSTAGLCVAVEELT